MEHNLNNLNQSPDQNSSGFNSYFSGKPKSTDNKHAQVMDFLTDLQNKEIDSAHQKGNELI